MNNVNYENKVYVVKRLIANGATLPQAIKAYKELSSDGWYEVEKTELKAWIKENLG